MKLHHIGMLSKDLDADAEHLCGACGYERASGRITDKIQTAEVLFLRLPGESSYLELVAPSGENSKIEGALKKGVKLHHICYQTENISADLENFRSKGFFVLCEPVEAAAFPGRRIAWIMDAKKNLIELVESGAEGMPLRA
ncbi:MAG: VOC family protein [Opitutales bacterium]|nr:VOC family protein [Opitutales bacterium]